MTDTPPKYRTVTLRDVDAAVRDWFDLTLDMHVTDPLGDARKVVVRAAAGERWVTSRQRQGFRDNKGVLILPILAIRRTSVDTDVTQTALGVETPNIVVSRRVHPKTNTLRNLTAVRAPGYRRPARPVVHEVTTVPFPDRVVVNYELQFQGQYIAQVNAFLERLMARLDIGRTFVAPFHNDGRVTPRGVPFEDRRMLAGDYVVGFFDGPLDDSGNFDEFTDTERIVRFTTQFRVPAALQLDPDQTRPAATVQQTAYKLSFGRETFRFVDDPEELDEIFKKTGR